MKKDFTLARRQYECHECKKIIEKGYPYVKKHLFSTHDTRGDSFRIDVRVCPDCANPTLSPDSLIKEMPTPERTFRDSMRQLHAL